MKDAKDLLRPVQACSFLSWVEGLRDWYNANNRVKKKKKAQV